MGVSKLQTGGLDFGPVLEGNYLKGWLVGR